MTDDDGETPLGAILKETIRRLGPMPVEHFMRKCLLHETYGYYRRQPAIGASGDFVTAPEISQIFGELIGLWCAVVWQQMGRPSKIHLVEFGPGRGTLMSDALRSARAAPGFAESLHVHLVEVNDALRAVQQATVTSSAALNWHAAWPQPEELSDAPVIVIGNEFLDALPVQQAVYRDGSWYHRSVGLDEKGNFCFLTGPSGNAGVPGSFRDGEICETSDDQARLIEHISRYRSVAALWIDYGFVDGQVGDTLQGVRAHTYVSPFSKPGETDLTAHVNFARLAQIAQRCGLEVDGPMTQAEFLGSLGAIERASKLMSANAAKASIVETGLARLMAPNGMGSRFKVMGMRSAQLPPLPGFPMETLR